MSIYLLAASRPLLNLRIFRLLALRGLILQAIIVGNGGECRNRSAPASLLAIAAGGSGGLQVVVDWQIAVLQLWHVFFMLSLTRAQS